MLLLFFFCEIKTIVWFVYFANEHMGTVVTVGIEVKAFTAVFSGHKSRYMLYLCLFRILTDIRYVKFTKNID